MFLVLFNSLLKYLFEIFIIQIIKETINAEKKISSGTALKSSGP
jgi:hypothetical protein